MVPQGNHDLHHNLEPSRHLLLPPPVAELPQRLKQFGLANPEARVAVTLLALLHWRFRDCSDINWVNRECHTSPQFAILTQMQPR